MNFFSKEFTGKLPVFRLLLLFTGLAAAAYIVYRAFALSFTIDEAYSWHNFVVQPGFFPEHPDTMLANHHLLNSWLMKISRALFGDAEFALRLPNVLAGMVYIFFAGAFARRMKPIIGLFFFMALVGHPYVLQFFSLARGYGLSFAGLLGGLYYSFLIITEGPKLKHLLLLNLFMLSGILANLTISFFVLPFLGIQFLLLLKEKQYRKKIILPIISFSGLLGTVLIVYFHGKHLSQYKALYYGEHFSFWNGSVSSVIWGLTGGAAWTRNAMAAVKMFIIVSSVIMCVTGIFLLIRKRTISFGTLLTASFFSCIVLLILLHFTGGVLYPLQRTGLYFVPLFFAAWIFTLNDFEGKLKPPAYLLGGTTVVFLLLNFMLTAKLTGTYEWTPQESCRELATDLKKLDPEGKKRVGIPWLESESMSYYRSRFGGPQQGIGGDDLFNFVNDFVICEDSQLKKADTRFLDLYRKYPGGANLFVKRKNFAPADQISTEEIDFGSAKKSGGSNTAFDSASGKYFMPLEGSGQWSLPFFCGPVSLTDTVWPVQVLVKFMYRLHGKKNKTVVFVGNSRAANAAVCDNITGQHSPSQTGSWQQYEKEFLLTEKFAEGDKVKLQLVNDAASRTDIGNISITANFYRRKPPR